MKNLVRLAIVLALGCAVPLLAQPAPQDNWTLAFSFAGASSAGAMQNPAAVAVTAGGQIVVADSSNHRIQVFNADGSFVRKWGLNGSADGQFNNPQGIAVAPDGTLVVADTGNNRVQVFNPDGTFVRTWGSSGSADGQLNGPASLAVAADGSVIVGDNGNSRVQVFTIAGTFVRKWGSAGGNEGQFYLGGVAVANDGKVFVADAGNGCIQVFSPDGTFIRRWGSHGNGDGQFQNTQRLNVATDGSVIVADTGNNRIQVFTSDGVFLRKWGNGGSAVGQFSSPQGIAISPEGNIGVADTYNHRVQIFNADGTFVRKIGYQGDISEGFGSDCSAIAVGSTGQVFVADYNNGSPSVHVFSGAGTALGRFRNDQYIYSLAIGPNELVYIGRYNSILVSDKNGTYVRTIGSASAGSGDGQSSGGQYIAVDVDGEIYTADSGNARVQVFDASGNFVRKFGEPGSGPGQLSGLNGIALTPEGALAVTANGQINYFTKSGQFIERLSGGSDGIRAIAPDGTLYFRNGQVAAPDRTTGANPAHVLLTTLGSYYASAIGIDPRSGAAFTFNASTRKVEAWRRGFRTLGANPPKSVPMPGVRAVAQRLNGYIDIDYSVTDGDSATVSTAVAAFRGGSSLLKDMVSVTPAMLMEGTAVKLGTGIATGQVHRLTWNPEGAGIPSGDLVFEVFARDDRPKLIDLDFIALPTTPALTISRIPITHADMRAAWAWLLLTSELGLTRAPDGEIAGPGGVAFTTTYLDYMVPGGYMTRTTPEGRAWLFQKLGVREATADEVNRARQATSTGTPNRFEVSRSQQMGNRPLKVNEWTFDSSDQYGSEAWWVVPL